MKAETQRGRSGRQGRMAGWWTGLAFLLSWGALWGGVPPANGQEVASAQAGVVKIFGLREGTPVQGSGFVVFITREQAIIVTAWHVIAGLQPLEVSFAVEPSTRFAAEPIGTEFGNPRGLAALEVRGALPTGINALTFEPEERPQPGEDLTVLGFPNRQARTPLTLRRSLAGWDGNFLLLDRPSGEGASGSPVLRRGHVVGVVVDEDPQFTFAVGAVVAQAAVLGWKVKLSGVEGKQVLLPVKPTAEPPTRPICKPGEEVPKDGIIFVRICGGTFKMGSNETDKLADSDEKPAHEVKVSEFLIGKTEITNSQYRKFRPHAGEDQLPATSVTWEEAKAACTFFGGRLPTEAEWEYAARAGSRSPWSSGTAERRLQEYAWYGANSGGNAHPVGEKKPNLWGLQDLHGNVWEWVSDRHGIYGIEPQSDPQGPTEGEKRVVRGGSFDVLPRGLRSAFRFGVRPEERGRNVGFRCVLTLDTPLM